MTGRPKPAILLSQIDPKNFKALEVLRADAIYAVFYEDTPINLRVNNKTAYADNVVICCRTGNADATSPIALRYTQTSFSNPGSAYRLQQRLNTRFQTDKFHVARLPRK